MSQSNNSAPESLKHIAFIMDGNGRWAKKRLMPRKYGHSKGASKFREIARYCADLGIDYITVYAFSTENWKRSEEEVGALMDIFREYISDAKRNYKKENVHAVFIGNRDVLDDDLKASMKELEELTVSMKTTLCLAINYGGRAEITDAVNKLIDKGATHITEDDITANIYSGVCPPPDMIVRTGGEIRLSNFLLWQSSYAELFFTETLWPDFSKEELNLMLEDFSKRKRNFGAH